MCLGQMFNVHSYYLVLLYRHVLVLIRYIVNLFVLYLMDV